jgi:hypothetical protein
VFKPFSTNFIKSFDDSSLPNQAGLPISVEKSQYLEEVMMPQIQQELENLRILRPELFVSNKSKQLVH